MPESDPPSAAPKSPPPKPDLSRVPPPPREPSERARKLVFGYQGAQWVLLLIGVIFLVIGFPFAAIFGWGLPGEILLDLTGVTTQGRVVSAEPDPSYRINKRVATRVKAEFRVVGDLYTAESLTVDRDLLEKAQPGREIDIEYAPGDPSIACIAGGSYSFFGYLGLLGLLFPVVGGALTFAAVRSNRREIRAFTHGEAALGRIVHVGPDLSTRVNGRHPTVVRWEVDVDGRTRAGEISSLDEGLLGDLLQAKEVVVLHDRDDPDVNTIWVE